MDPSLLSLISATIEKTLNTAFRYDPGTRARLSEYSGKTVQITVSDFEIYLQLGILEEGITLALSNDSSDADVCLAGKLRDLLALGQRPSYSLADSGVQAQGDLSLLQALRDIQKHLEIDWQDALSDHLGEALSTPLSALIRSGKNYIDDQLHQGSEHLSAYLCEELELMPQQAELNIAKEKIRNLREDADRLQAKFNAFLESHQNRDAT